MSRLALSHAADAGPLLRRGRRVEHVTLLQIAALVLPVLVAASLLGPDILGILFAAAVAALFWEAAFAALRRRRITANGLSTALVVAVMAPDGAALWQVGLAVSFGAAIGELIFGGRGFGLVNPALLALTFLLFSFPGTELRGDSVFVALATVPGAILLLATGLLSWRVALGTVAGLLAVALLRGGGWPGAEGVAAALLFPLVFLIGDPIQAAATNWGRWIYGALAGALAAALSPVDGLIPGAVAFAALVAAIAAPLIDDLVIRAIAWRRDNG